MIKLNRLSFDTDPAGIVADDCVSDYNIEEGLLVIPVMGPVGTPPVIARVHAPFTSRRANFAYARSKRPPLIPTPGDTIGGDIFIGGNFKLGAPKQNAEGYLVYSITGGYNFIRARDVRDENRIRFDAHGYPSLIDVLGHANINPFPVSPGAGDDVWQMPYFDLDLLSSARILG